MHIEDESLYGLHQASGRRIVLVGQLETCQILGNAIRKARSDDKSSPSANIKLAWTLSLNGVHLGSICQSYILIVIEPENEDWVDIATSELNYLSSEVFDNRVDVVLWKKVNTTDQHADTIMELMTKYELLIYPIISDINESVDINAVKFYNRMKMICLHPEVNRNLFKMTL